MVITGNTQDPRRHFPSSLGGFISFADPLPQMFSTAFSFLLCSLISVNHSYPFLFHLIISQYSSSTYLHTYIYSHLLL